MKIWKKEKFNIERLESAMETGIPELITRVFDAYERDVERLKEIETRCDTRFGITQRTHNERLIYFRHYPTRSTEQQFYRL